MQPTQFPDFYDELHEIYAELKKTPLNDQELIITQANITSKVEELIIHTSRLLNPESAHHTSCLLNPLTKDPSSLIDPNSRDRSNQAYRLYKLAFDLSDKGYGVLALKIIKRSFNEEKDDLNNNFRWYYDDLSRFFDKLSSSAVPEDQNNKIIKIMSSKMEMMETFIKLNPRYFNAKSEALLSSLADKLKSGGFDSFSEDMSRFIEEIKREKKENVRNVSEALDTFLEESHPVSDEEMIIFINSYKPIHKIMMTEEELTDFLNRYGKEITSLDLSSTKYDHIKLINLCPNIKNLSLNKCNIGDEKLVSLASTEAMNNMITLELEENGLTAPGIKAFMKVQEFPRLEKINLSSNDIYDEGVKWVAKSFNIPEVKELDFSNTKMGLQGLRALGASNLRGITKFRFANNGLDDKAAMYIVGFLLPKLIEVDLSENTITDKGAISIANLPNSSKFINLNLSQNYIGYSGVKALRTSKHLTQADLNLDNQNK